MRLALLVALKKKKKKKHRTDQIILNSLGIFLFYPEPLSSASNYVNFDILSSICARILIYFLPSKEQLKLLPDEGEKTQSLEHWDFLGKR